MLVAWSELGGIDLARGRKDAAVHREPFECTLAERLCSGVVALAPLIVQILSGRVVQRPVPEPSSGRARARRHVVEACH